MWIQRQDIELVTLFSAPVQYEGKVAHIIWSQEARWMWVLNLCDKDRSPCTTRRRASASLAARYAPEVFIENVCNLIPRAATRRGESLRVQL